MAGYDKARYPARAKKMRANSRAYKKAHHTEGLRYMKDYRRNHPLLAVLHNAAKRARLFSVPFSLSLKTLPSLPKRCPVFPWLRLEKARNLAKPNSPSLDRIKPKLGYVLGNVRWISFRANMIKSNATLRELTAVTKDARRN